MIECFACGIKFKEAQYIKHMELVHSGMNQTDAMQAKKNIPPKQQSPIVLDKDTPPSDSFMEVAQMLDKPKNVPPVNIPVSSTPARNDFGVQEERKPLPITLEYNYTGECPKCFISLKTVIVHTAGKCFAVAICMNHGQLKEREVADLEEYPYDEGEISKPLQHELNEIEKIRKHMFGVQRKEVKKRGKQRPKSQLQPEATL